MAPRKRRSSGKFLSTDQIDNATDLVTSIWKLTNAGPIALVGGAAMEFYGSDRFTKDVDFIAEETYPADDLTDRALNFVSDLSFGGRRYMTKSAIPVDVIVRSDDSAKLYEAALDNAEPTEDGFLIVSPEYLVAMKFDAMRTKDQGDLLWLLAQKELVDVSKAKRIIKEYLGGQWSAREFIRFVNEAKWRAGKGEFKEKLDDGSEE